MYDVGTGMLRYQSIRSRPPVDPGAVVDAVVRPVGVREGGYGPLGVVRHHRYVGGEERLVILVRPGGHVGPPQERLRLVGSVVESDLELDQRRIRAQADTVHPLHPGERVVVGTPDRHRPVGVVLDQGVGGQVGRRTVVLRPVELHAAGDPRPGESD